MKNDYMEEEDDLKNSILNYENSNNIIASNGIFEN
jgi:hypothetical protein